MNIYNVILGPVESHKSRMLEAGKTYTFRVADEATKTDIKKAFHDLYGRTVSSIQVAKNYLKVRNGKKGTMRRRASYKKAYVTLDKAITHLANLKESKN